jgi:farnesyl diphosphate synthase
VTTDPTPVAAFLSACRQRVDRALDHCLPADSLHPAMLHAAMRYAILGGGKRIRPALVYAAGQAAGAVDAALDAPACAVELIHGYSLVHDDLPCMDDDDLRRGRPTLHKQYDEATATLAGDALQALAFQVLADARGVLPPQRRLAMIELLAQASGSRGMVGGQTIDLGAVGKQLDIAELEDMHIHKTGALIRAGVLLGAMCKPDTDAAIITALGHYAACIGLAYQIHDDILDVEGDTAQIGKISGADAQRMKPTYPELLGLNGARERARELVNEAHLTLAMFGACADALRQLCDYTILRRR